MKKILTSTIMIIAVWAISTFIISNQTQNEFENYLQRSNKLYANSGLELNLTSYQSSFLTSKATMEISFKDKKVEKMLEKEYVLPIKVDYTIEHGPLFFKDRFGFGLAKISNNLKVSSLFKEETRKEFLEVVKDDINLKSNMIIAFNKELNYDIKSDEIAISKDKIEFAMKPLELKGTTNIETFKGDGKISISELQIEENSSNNGIFVKDLTIDIKVDEIIDNNLILGAFDFSIAQLNIKDDTNPNLKDINLAVDGKMSNLRASETTMNSMFEGDINFKNTKLPNELKELETIHLTMNMQDLGIKGMIEFQEVAKEMQEKQTKLLSQLDNKSSQEMQPLFKEFQNLQNEMLKKLIYSLNNLLIKDKTSLSYGLIFNTKDKSSSNALIEIGYTGDIDFKGTPEELIQKAKAQLLSLIRLKVDIELNKRHISMIPVPMLEQQLQMGIAQGFIKDNNSSYTLNAYYKNKELMVNDNNLTNTILPMLMMLTAK